MKVATYSEWRRAKLAQLDDEDLIECPKCYGDGVIDDYCHHCGRSGEEDCDLCECVGKMPFGELPMEWEFNIFSRDRYRKELVNDLESLAGWMGKELYELLVDLGMRPYLTLNYQTQTQFHKGGGKTEKILRISKGPLEFDMSELLA